MVDGLQRLIDVIAESLPTQYPLNLTETEYVGRGIGSVVFRAKAGTNVLKFEQHPLADTVLRASTEGISIAEAEASVASRRSAKLARWQRRYATLENYFAGHVVPTEVAMATVMISGGVLREGLGPGGDTSMIDADATYSLSTFVRTQPFAEFVADPTRLSLHGSRAELGHGLSTDAYVALSRQSLPVTDDDRGHTVDHDLFAAVYGRPPVVPAFADARTGVLRVVAAARQDPTLRPVLRDILRRGRDFVIDQDEFVDYLGEDNLVLYRRDGEWRWELVDPLTRGVVGVDATLGLLGTIAAGAALSSRELDDLGHVLNLARCHNVIADLLDAPDLRLELPERVRSGRRPVPWATVLHAMQDDQAADLGTGWKATPSSAGVDAATTGDGPAPTGIAGTRALSGAREVLRRAREMSLAELDRQAERSAQTVQQLAVRLEAAGRGLPEPRCGTFSARCEEIRATSAAIEAAFSTARTGIVQAIDQDVGDLTEAGTS
ncbi:MAG TPA: hypothetical protein VIP77_25160 [Jiangellaceae bacterium]